jgi:spermidine dehydrogenase
VSGRDVELGMHRDITRRDFLNGVGVMAAGAVLPGCATPGTPTPYGSPVSADTYPPLRSGMRGNHPGSFDAAHALAFDARRDWGPTREPDDGTYDLVVVGGGISGLSAAYFEQQRNGSARILILDNHDDFGGHAKRNEFEIDDRTVIGYGGSQSLEGPEYYSSVSKGLLRDLGVELEAFETAYDRDFCRRNDLSGGTFFDAATYGVDRLVPYPVLDFATYLPLAPSQLSAAQAVAAMPLSPPARQQMLRLLETREDRMGSIPAEKQEAYLATISYRQFLERHLDISEPEVFALLQGISTDLGVTLDTASAIASLSYVGMPGIHATSLPYYGFEDAPYIAHFPDGNASIARLLVRAMIPRAATGSNMYDIVGARFDYARLDEPSARVRLRLDSTVIRAEHEGPPESSGGVAITYVRGNRSYRVRARKCVLASYNAMIPYLCPELPKNQREALAQAVKSPILYSSILLRNWRPFKELGIAAVSAPGSYHQNALLDFPVSLGGYTFSSSPDEPVIVHMERFGTSPNAGLSPRDQFRAERHRMFSTPYTDIERAIRVQLTGMLSSAGFDPARDIEAITVNRWAHGYAYYPNPLFDDVNSGDAAPNVVGRARFGRIVIANSDAGGRAMLDTAIDQANRAIEELAGV